MTFKSIYSTVTDFSSVVLLARWVRQHKSLIVVDENSTIDKKEEHLEIRGVPMVPVVVYESCPVADESAT